MTKRRDDKDIAHRFRGLRADTEGSGRIPDFQAMLDRARRDAEDVPSLEVVDGARPPGTQRRGRRRTMWLGGSLSAALAAAVAALLLTTGGPSPDEEFDRLVASFAAEATGTWQSPTSRLLEVPGIELTRTVPSVGRSLPAPGSGERPGTEGSQGREGRS